MKQQLSDAELTAYSEEHLLYELRMLYFAGTELAKTLPDPLRSALLESFAIHLRNLIDFFTVPKGKERDTDVIAADFAPAWSQKRSATFEDAKVRADKEVSHLTLGRKDGLDASKPWQVGALFHELQPVAEHFAAAADPKKLSQAVVEWIKKTGAQRTFATMNLQTTNTTASVIMTAGPSS
jgi:hypothetical protein